MRTSARCGRRSTAFELCSRPNAKNPERATRPNGWATPCRSVTRPEEPLPATGVYFFDAEWCGPCRQMRPLVERLKREGLPILAVNADQHQDLLRDLHIEMLPTLVLMIGGKEKERATGSMDAAKLRALLAKIPNGPATAATSKAGTTGHVERQVQFKDCFLDRRQQLPPALHGSSRFASGDSRHGWQNSRIRVALPIPWRTLWCPRRERQRRTVNGNLEKLDRTFDRHH